MNDDIPDEAIEAMQGARFDHDASQHRPCADHPHARWYCCPAGDAHEMVPSEVINHRDRAALAAAYPALTRQAIEDAVTNVVRETGHLLGDALAADRERIANALYAPPIYRMVHEGTVYIPVEEAQRVARGESPIARAEPDTP